MPQEAHLRSLGAALCAAITRDFAPEQRRVGALPRLLPEHVHQMARAQLELQAMINEKKAELERLNTQHESLQRVEAEQKADAEAEAALATSSVAEEEVPEVLLTAKGKAKIARRARMLEREKKASKDEVRAPTHTG